MDLQSVLESDLVSSIRLKLLVLYHFVLIVFLTQTGLAYIPGKRPGILHMVYTTCMVYRYLLYSVILILRLLHKIVDRSPYEYLKRNNNTLDNTTTCVKGDDMSFNLC